MHDIRYPTDSGRSYFADGNLRRLPQPMKDRLVKAACAVDLDRLPVIGGAGRGAITDHDVSS